MRSSALQEATRIIAAEDRFNHKPILVVDFYAFTANHAQSGFSEDLLCHYTERAATAAEVEIEGGSPAALGYAVAQPRSLTSDTGFGISTTAAGLVIDLHRNLRTKRLVLVLRRKTFACYGGTASHRSAGCVGLETESGFQR